MVWVVQSYQRDLTHMAYSYSDPNFIDKFTACLGDLMRQSCTASVQTKAKNSLVVKTKPKTLRPDKNGRNSHFVLLEHQKFLSKASKCKKQQK